MKKLFVLAIATGMFVACNNATTTSNDSTVVPTDSPVVVPAADTNAIVAGDSSAIVAGDSTKADSTHKH
ncbi:hypothetical protein [Chitinophaga deserti]|uniref:hypothetical protein n=1 Tax=Chitinophaga deserti TaxID=2164099 RepID=UPI000D6AFD51|nr:hypothetical protein [Chitinophaga deserti]